MAVEKAADAARRHRDGTGDAVGLRTGCITEALYGSNKPSEGGVTSPIKLRSLLQLRNRTATADSGASSERGAYLLE